MADKLFADQIRELEKGLKSSSNATEGMKRNFAELDKFARQLASSVDDLQDNFQDVVDISKQYFNQSKGILHTNIQNVDISKEITKAQKDNNHEFVKYLKGIETEFNQKKKIQKGALKQLQTIESIGEVAGQIPMIGGSLSKVIGNFGEAYKEALGGSKTKPEAVGKSLTKAFKGAGLAISLFITKGLFDAMQQTGAGLMDILKRPEFILFGNSSAAIANEFGNMESSSLKLGFQMKMMSVFSGVSAENQAKIMGMMAATSDSSNEALMAQMKSYKQAGVPFRAIMDDVASNTEFFAKFAKDGGANIFDAAKRAKELGVNLSDVASISESLLNFEESIEAQMNAQVLLGRNISLDRARQLAFSGDQVGMMNEIVSQVGGEAEFNKLNVIQRKALADSVGLSVERMGALVRAEEENAKATEATKGKYIMIASVIGGIIGLIAGALIGSGILAGMGVGVLAGAGVGLVGGIAMGAGVGAMLPSFQTGPGEAKTVAETGPAVVHQGETIGRFSTKALEKKLDALIDINTTMNENIIDIVRG
jgi:hypothetical protein